MLINNTKKTNCLQNRSKTHHQKFQGSKKKQKIEQKQQKSNLKSRFQLYQQQMAEEIQVKEEIDDCPSNQYQYQLDLSKTHTQYNSYPSNQYNSYPNSQYSTYPHSQYNSYPLNQYNPFLYNHQQQQQQHYNSSKSNEQVKCQSYKDQLYNKYKNINISINNVKINMNRQKQRQNVQPNKNLKTFRDIDMNQLRMNFNDLVQKNDQMNNDYNKKKIKKTDNSVDQSAQGLLASNTEQQQFDDLLKSIKFNEQNGCSLFGYQQSGQKVKTDGKKNMRIFQNLDLFKDLDNQQDEQLMIDQIGDNSNNANKGLVGNIDLGVKQPDVNQLDIDKLFVNSTHIMNIEQQDTIEIEQQNTIEIEQQNTIEIEQQNTIEVDKANVIEIESSKKQTEKKQVDRTSRKKTKSRKRGLQSAQKIEEESVSGFRLRSAKKTEQKVEQFKKDIQEVFEKYEYQSQRNQQIFKDALSEVMNEQDSQKMERRKKWGQLDYGFIEKYLYSQPSHSYNLRRAGTQR